MLIGYWKIPNSLYEGYNCQDIQKQLRIKMVLEKQGLKVSKFARI
jgi:hypothetical protein